MESRILSNAGFRPFYVKFPTYEEFRDPYNRQQCFSLPASIIYYITKKAENQKVYEKLIKSCKYFFIKNPIIDFHCLVLDKNNGWKTCVKQSCLGPPKNRRYRKIGFNVEKLQSKIRIFFALEISSSTFSVVSLIPKLYNNDIQSLLLNQQNISFNDLLFFSPNKLRRCILFGSTVTFENGAIVPSEIILANFPNLEVFDCRFDAKQIHNFSNTVTELLKIFHFKNLSIFYLCGLNESFDIDKFYGFLKNNQKTSVFLWYYGPLSDEYKNKLQTITDEIIDVETPRKFKPSFIQFNGQLRRKELYELYVKHL